VRAVSGLFEAAGVERLGFDSRSHREGGREGGLGGGWAEEDEEDEEERGVEGGGSCGGGRRAPGQVPFFCALMARFKSVVIFLKNLLMHVIGPVLFGGEELPARRRGAERTRRGTTTRMVKRLRSWRRDASILPLHTHDGRGGYR